MRHEARMMNPGVTSIIAAKIKNEKDDALCLDSPTNIHFLQMHLDSEGRVLPVDRFACEVCGQPVKANGARWVLDRYIIAENDDIEDLL